jgi:hypothetical protein
LLSRYGRIPVVFISLSLFLNKLNEFQRTTNCTLSNLVFTFEVELMCTFEQNVLRYKLPLCVVQLIISLHCFAHILPALVERRAQLTICCHQGIAIVQCCQIILIAQKGSHVSTQGKYTAIWGTFQSCNEIQEVTLMYTAMLEAYR